MTREFLGIRRRPSDVRDLRKGFKDGPFSIEESSRPLLMASLAAAFVKNDDQGNTRLSKRNNGPEGPRRRGGGVDAGRRRLGAGNAGAAGIGARRRNGGFHSEMSEATEEPWGITKSEHGEFYLDEWYVDGAGLMMSSQWPIGNGEANAHRIAAAPDDAGSAAG